MQQGNTAVLAVAFMAVAEAMVGKLPEVVRVLWLRNCFHLCAPVGHGRVTV